MISEYTHSLGSRFLFSFYSFFYEFDLDNPVFNFNKGRLVSSKYGANYEWGWEFSKSKYSETDVDFFDLPPLFWELALVL